MPSYRRDRPGRPAPSERRGPPGRREPEEESEEESEEGPQERGQHGFRSSRFARPGLEPIAPARQEQKEWWEYMVPEREKADPEYRYSRVYDLFRPSSRATASAYQRDAAASSSYQQQARRRTPQIGDVSRFLDLERIWNAIRQAKSDPRFRRGSPVAIMQFSRPIPDDQKRAEDMIRTFRISREDVEQFHPSEYWSGLIQPFLEELAYAVSYAKPADIPGTFRFQKVSDPKLAENGSVWLAYQE